MRATRTQEESTAHHEREGIGYLWSSTRLINAGNKPHENERARKEKKNRYRRSRVRFSSLAVSARGRLTEAGNVNKEWRVILPPSVVREGPPC